MLQYSKVSVLAYSEHDEVFTLPDPVSQLGHFLLQLFWRVKEFFGFFFTANSRCHHCMNLGVGGVVAVVESLELWLYSSTARCC